MSAAEPDSDFESLLLYLQQSRGFDFTGYKRTTLVRRVRKRMGEVDLQDFGEYLDYLQVHPHEFALLFNTILINVTSFFRDREAWDYLASEAIPRILDARSADEPIRCWCAGTASGEEAYSLAMLLTEAIGEEGYRQRVKIYATDVDEEALTQARPGGYTAKEVEPVPAPMLDRHFERVGGRYVFRSDLRRSLIFGRHDLVQDAPISRLDLLVCRNTLMYFTAEAQGRILARLHYALNDDGLLFLGKAEMLLTHTRMFAPLDLRHRIFTKVPKVNLRDPLMMVSQAGNLEAGQEVGRQIRMLELAHEAMQAAQLIVDVSGHVTRISENARGWFGLNTRDVGRLLQDLEVSCRPTELRSLIERAYDERRPVGIAGVERLSSDTGPRHLDVHVTPLIENSSAVLGVSITFLDVTGYHQLQDELERSRQDLETAYEELQSSNEELETTNEELQSTVEELETTNEELQSSNEELETMNEELESTNSELQAINGELRQRTEEVEQVNVFTESVLRNLQVGVVVVDADLRIKMWQGRSEELWGLRAPEVFGQPLMELDVGLPLKQVREVIRESLADPNQTHERTLTATNRRGRTIQCRVVASTISMERMGSGVILLAEEVRQD